MYLTDWCKNSPSPVCLRWLSLDARLLCFFDFLCFRSTLSPPSVSPDGFGTRIEYELPLPLFNTDVFISDPYVGVDLVLSPVVAVLMIVCGLPSSRVVVITVNRGNGGGGGIKEGRDAEDCNGWGEVMLPLLWSDLVKRRLGTEWRMLPFRRTLVSVSLQINRQTICQGGESDIFNAFQRNA